MSSVVISGDTSGAITVSAPLVAGTNTLTLQAGTGIVSMNTLQTSVASTSGTSIDFTGIPSWAKRITVMFQGVSTSSTSVVQIQVGAGSVTTSGYVSSWQSGTTAYTQTSGFGAQSMASATDTRNGSFVLTNITGNTWVSTAVLSSGGASMGLGSGSIALGGTLDRVRITTVNGIDTFDAGSVNILYEG
jgi:hypothetical protein